ncbi:CIC11C00000004168 [Sungouiella intermedia]|uniref:CIC11C00000004168 n=1 Tax=Sungouiella intermedia TaxID=45354 RepID=A0A1L0FT74_9ASCO|nr:CIC11C00000004168 [[Candida] intermedia]
MPSPFAPTDSKYVFNNYAECGIPFDKLAEKHLALPDSDDSIAIPGLAEPGYSATFRCKASKSLKTALSSDLETYYHLWKNAVTFYGDKPAFSSRPYDYKTQKSEPRYVTKSFTEVDTLKRNLGSGIMFLLRNNPFKNPDIESHRKIDAHTTDYASYDKDNHSFIVTLYLANREEWVLADLACVSYAITNTVLYDTLGDSASEYILELTESPIVISSYEHVETIISLKEKFPDRLAALISLVSMDPLDCQSASIGEALVRRARAARIELYDYNQVFGIGELFPHADLPPSPKTTYTISFTSGTTGNAPKGVVLTQENAASGVTFLACRVPRIKNDTALSFLPLAHIFERQALAYNLVLGGLAGFPQHGGSALTLIEDLKLFKPKHMTNVPRVYTKMETAIKNATVNLDLALKKSLFEKCIGIKYNRQGAADEQKGELWVYDQVLMPKLRAALGFDNMVYCITGLAPISPLTVKFMKAALGIGFSQGYGLTELFAGFSFSSPYEKVPGSCGAPGLCTEIRVRELPAMGYALDDPRGPSGELEIRGGQIFSHYYKNLEETAKCLKDGWFSTGDVARIDKNGRIFIIDRVKNFFKLSQGEYVTPEKVENAYLSGNTLLTQCFVHGNSLNHFLVAVVGVDPEKIVHFLSRKCGVNKSELLSESAILEHVNKHENRTKLLRELNKNVKGLQGFETVQNLYIEFEPLRLEREVITPTVKIRRPIAAKYFASQIDSMYGEQPLATKQKL